MRFPGLFAEHSRPPETVKTAQWLKTLLKNNVFIAGLNSDEESLIENLKLNYQDLLNQPLSELENQKDPAIILFLKLYNFVLEEQKKLVKESREEIINLGGLHVIGTERHESRRIDNQLRGRAGRQGDPG